VAALLLIAGALIILATGWLIGRYTRRPDPTDDPIAPVATDGSSPVASPSFADLVDELPLGVVVAGPDRAITYRNAAATVISGTHVGVLVEEAIERHVAAGQAGNGSDEVLEMFGPPKSVLALLARPTPDGGAVVFIEDISEQRRIEHARTDFVANISHELKTPVGALYVLAETLEDESDPEIVRRLVHRMMDEAQRASRTIDDLIELSRIELERAREVESVMVNDVLRRAVDRVTEIAAHRSVRVSTVGAVGDDPPADTLSVDGDHRQLVSAVGNLVENAVKYSRPGGLVQVRTKLDGDWLEIVVVDEGVGIPQRDLHRVFERFYRVDPARSRDTGGTGLGLSIVRHVATNHHGQVTVASVEGEGSTFTLRLPVRTDNAEAAAPIDSLARNLRSAVEIEGVA
jgi:two-component system sensor histidine kinase SenX3